MDNSRKHDSIGTKSHSTASSSSAVSSCMQAASNLQQTSTATTSSASTSAPPPPPPTPEQNTASSNAIMSSSTTASATSSTAIMSSAAAGNNGMLLSGSSQPSSAVAAATAPAAAPAAVNSTSASIAPSATTALAMLPHYSASSFSLPHPGSSSALGAGIGSGVPASFGGGAASTTSSSSKNVQRPAVFDKLESLVQDMQDKVHGVPVRHQKVFLTSIPFAFMGYDLIEWLMDRLSIEDSLEAVHLANLLCQFGYYFPIGELKNLLVKDDSSLYRFQSPYYWPSQHHTPDNIEYAIYLAKRSQQRKREKHGLEDYEVEAYNNLKKILANKWDFVMMQSEEQLRVAKDRKRDDKQIIDSQEKAYWRVYRPPPGYTTVVESSPVPTREHRIKARSRTKEHILEEVKFLREYASMIRCKVAQVADNLIDYTDTFFDFDPVLNSVGPSSPWITDDQTYWLLNQPIVDTPTEKRVRKWEISLDDLVVDPLGVKELMEYMKKEYSHENLRFWLSVQELRYGSGTEAKIKKKVKEIWDEFLSPGAKAEINIDGKTMEATKVAMKSPSRYTFEVAAGHIYLLLLKKDCYPRFIRSENYKAILANAINPGNVKRRIFNFPRVPKRPLKSAAPACTGSGTNTHQGRMPEDFNVYGIHGAGQGDSPPDGHEDFPTTTRYSRLGGAPSSQSSAASRHLMPPVPTTAEPTTTTATTTLPSGSAAAPAAGGGFDFHALLTPTVNRRKNLFSYRQLSA